MQGLKVAGVDVDRKVLAELAVSDEAAFAALVVLARDAVPPVGDQTVGDQATESDSTEDVA